MRCQLIKYFSLVTLLIIGVSSASWATTYTFTTIDPPGARETFPFRINNAGQIVGTFSLASGGGSFLYSAGSFTQFVVSGSLGTTPSGINDVGQIVGGFVDSFSHPHGFVYAAGTFTQIDVPGAFNTQAAGINDAGQIVGVFQDAITFRV